MYMYMYMYMYVCVCVCMFACMYICIAFKVHQVRRCRQRRMQNKKGGLYFFWRKANPLVEVSRRTSAESSAH